ncbi:MAG: Protein translocase subunit SecA [Anaerolineales bacterium]|nr:Protein translocase subunit SecA [Anaerolineales bacterium]
MLKGFVKLFSGDTHKRTMESLFPLVDEINALEPEFEKLTDEELRAKTDEFRARLSNGETLDDLLDEAFAVVREAAKRTIRLRHYDVQLIGGIILHRGEIAEMRTGEGKTLVATLPIYLNALTGRGVHLVTVNDYLARRDARWMGPIFHALGLSVGILQMAAATENGKKAFLYDPGRESPHEDQHNMRLVERVEAYAADITYGTNSEFGFDYLRDNMAMRLEDRVQRGHHYAIVDEVDNVLIDEARTPLIISGPASGDLEWYTKMAQVVRQLKSEDYDINEKDRAISLTEVGIARVEGLLGQPLQDPDRPEDVTPEQARLMGYLEQALRAQHLFRRNRDYLVQAGKVIIVDESTGRMMPGRRWSDGLHQAVEAKEGVRIEPESVTYATITLQNYFRMYEKLSGMTGTALTESEEFDKIYKLEVAPIITNLEYQASRPDSPLVEVKGRDEDGYPVVFFSSRSDEEKKPRYWRRKDYPDVIYRTVEAKQRAVVTEIVRNHVMGRPLLIGTTSVENSDFLSSRLRAEAIRRLLQVLLIRKLWFEQNQREEDGMRIPELEPLNVPLEKLDPAALRQFAKPLGLTTINLEDAENLPRLLEILSLRESDAPRLKTVFAGGIPHQVLNARKHTEESQIIAGAGAFGAATIATSMAGRGVDIKLGGEIDETDVTFTKDFLYGAGVANPYDMTNPEALEALVSHLLRGEDLGFRANGDRLEYFDKARAALVGKYGRPGGDDWSQLSNILYANLGLGLKASESLAAFWKHTEQELIVRALGGLAVLATERHEARRIDNQLRGRAARQGDPGSSRFYLSLEDDLMRIQGGEQVSNMMTRLRVDDAFPLEVKLVSNIIEQSQHRVEGANFDVRKHLLEYDDVLNKQRTQIYGQRDRIFVKEDLRDDVQEMLEAEVRKRVETAREDEENFWRLPAWLEQVQPTFQVSGELYPSFPMKVIRDEFASSPEPGRAAVHLADRTLEIEHGHLQRAIETAIQRADESLEAQMKEREDLLDMFFSGLRDNEEKPRPQQLLEELQSLAHVPVKLDNNQLRALANDPDSVEEEIRELVADQLTDLAATRLVGAVENRLGESLGFSKEDLSEMAFEDLTAEVAARSQAALTRQRERLTGEDGLLARDARSLLERENLADDSSKLRFLLSLSQGQRNVFDTRTHRQVKQVYQRFDYSFLASELMQEMPAEDLVEEILDHLEGAEDKLTLAWGRDESFQRGEPAEGQDEAKLREAGSRLLNESRRRLLLSAITELWVDYLTRVEALRVAIGLEAYAQRDPLVQYKARASEMFQGLLEEIRGAVIGRLFAVQRRPSLDALEEAAAEADDPKPAAQPQSGGKKKRKRH